MFRSSQTNRSGFALLEAMLALMLLGVAMTSLLELSRATITANLATTRFELELLEASELMEAVSLWPIDDLTKHLGPRAQGKFEVTIDRIAPSLFAIGIAGRGTKRLLQTVVYRPCCQNP